MFMYCLNIRQVDVGIVSGDVKQCQTDFLLLTLACTLHSHSNWLAISMAFVCGCIESLGRSGSWARTLCQWEMMKPTPARTTDSCIRLRTYKWRLICLYGGEWYQPNRRKHSHHNFDHIAIVRVVHLVATALCVAISLMVTNLCRCNRTHKTIYIECRATI